MLLIGGRSSSRYKVSPAPFETEDSEQRFPIRLRSLIAEIEGDASRHPKWCNLDGVLSGCQDDADAVRRLDAALRSQTPRCSLETLSMRYCVLTESAVGALVQLLACNVSIETLYLHSTHLSEKARASLTAAWQAHGSLHRNRSAIGFTLRRTINTQFVTNRARFVPAWALKASAAVNTKPKKKGKKGKKAKK